MPQDLDLAAELTLQGARLLQAHPTPAASFEHWFFMPEFHRATWEEARTLLSKAPKPLLVSPLNEPGMIATWRFDVMGPPLRSAADYHWENQTGYYDAKLKVCGYDESSAVELKAPSGTLILPVPEFRRWYREYLFQGVTILKTSDPQLGRLAIRPPGGGGPPIGWDPSLPTDDHHHH